MRVISLFRVVLATFLSVSTWFERVAAKFPSVFCINGLVPAKFRSVSSLHTSLEAKNIRESRDSRVSHDIAGDFSSYHPEDAGFCTVLSDNTLELSNLQENLAVTLR